MMSEKEKYNYDEVTAFKFSDHVASGFQIQFRKGTPFQVACALVIMQMEQELDKLYSKLQQVKKVVEDM